jgi:Flp pilus assembly protein TadG
MVEFALVVPVLLIVVLGLLDFGRAIYAYNSISNAARTAVRVAIVDQKAAVIEAAAVREAVGISPLTFVHSACTTQDCTYGITVKHAFVAATPIIGSIVGPITIESTARMPVEREYSTP